MKLREVERLRAVAILMVMVVHWGPLKALLPEGATDPWSGVDLFFVVSGYVVTLSLVRHLPPLEAETSFVDALRRASLALRTFYVRRFFRILPAALAVLLLVRLLAGIFPQKFGTPRDWQVELVTFFGGVFNYVHPFRHFKLGIYWSLSVEEHFYLVLPVLFVVFRTTNRRLAACAGLALLSVALRALPKPAVAMENLGYYEKFSSHLRFDTLMAGVALALVAGTGAPGRPLMPPRVMRWFILPAAIVILVCLPRAAPSYVMHREGFIALWMLSGLLVAYAGMDRGYVLPIPGVGRALEYIGSRSYALYLVHTVVIRFDEALHDRFPAYAHLAPMDARPPWGRLAVLVPMALVAAELLHRAVERPFMALGRRVVEGAGAPLLSPRIRRAMAAAGVLFGVFYFRHGLLLALGGRNLARGAVVTLSTQMENKPPPEALTNGTLEPEYGLHTEREQTPWATIDLGAVIPIGALRIYNRDDGYHGDDLPLEVQLSNDGVSFQTVARRAEMFTQEWPWRVRFAGARTRYIRFQVPRETALCLSEVEVFASSTMALVP